MDNKCPAMLKKVSEIWGEQLTPRRCLLLLILIAFACIQLFYSTVGIIGTLEIRAIHLTFALVICFFPSGSEKPARQAVKFVIAVLSIVTLVYFIFNNYRISTSFFRLTSTDMFMGCLLIVVLLIGTFKKLGWALPAVAVCALLYGVFGHMIPGAYGHPEYTLKRIVSIIYVGTEGIFGTSLGVIVNTVMLFVIFGGFLDASGAGEFFVDISKALCGKAIGGPAKIAVVSSMLMGSISGSTVANVVATGTFTIPLMKRTGYPEEFSAAVEATSSTGGQIMPPIMGAGAFLLAEMAGIPYSHIVVVSIIPAALYYLALFIAVHCEARKLKLRPLDAKEIPNAWTVVKEKGIYALPLVVLLYMILVTGYTVEYSCVFAIVVMLVIGLIKKKGHERWKFILKGIRDGVSSVIPISLACGCAGIVVAMVNLTGLGYNFSRSLLLAAHNSTFLALIFIFLLGFVLGMGLPTVSAFVVMISVCGIGLTQLGLPIIVAYLIVFWDSQTSAITPPVCTAAYAAASIAKADPMRVGWRAVTLGFPLLIIPFMMAYCPIIIGTGTVLETVFAVFSCTVGTIAFSVLFIGFYKVRFSAPDYILTILAGLCSFHPAMITDFLGLALLLLFFFGQQKKYRKEQSAVQ